MDSLGFFVHSFSQIHFITHLTNIIYKEKEVHKEERLHTEGSDCWFCQRIPVQPENLYCPLWQRIYTSSSTRELVLPILPENLYC